MVNTSVLDSTQSRGNQSNQVSWIVFPFSAKELNFSTHIGASQLSIKLKGN